MSEKKKNKGGRPRNFNSPDEVWEVFQKYREKLKKNAENWPKIQYVGKDGRRVVDTPVLPMTIEGFMAFCYDEGYGDIANYWYNTRKQYDSFATIVARIKIIIRDQQITGSLIGNFNPNLTARINGLGDKQQLEKTKIVVKRKSE